MPALEIPINSWCLCCSWRLSGSFSSKLKQYCIDFTRVCFTWKDEQDCESLFSGWNFEIQSNLANIFLFSFQDTELRKVHAVHGMWNFFEYLNEFFMHFFRVWPNWNTMEYKRKYITSIIIKHGIILLTCRVSVVPDNWFNNVLFTFNTIMNTICSICVMYIKTYFIYM